MEVLSNIVNKMGVWTWINLLIAALVANSCEGEGASFYYPQTRRETFGKGLRYKHLSGGSTDTLEDQIKIGRDFLLMKLDLDPSDLEISRHFQDHLGIVHVYASHIVDGLPVSNHRAQVHLKNGKITSFSSSFQGGDHPQLERRDNGQELDLDSAIEIAQKSYGIPALRDFAKTGWIENSNQRLVKVSFIQLKAFLKWIEVAVDMKNGVSVSFSQGGTALSSFR